MFFKDYNMKRISIFFLAAFIAIAGGCTPESKVDPENGYATSGHYNLVFDDFVFE